MKIGYHASHEQFLPSELLSLIVKAEKAGFQSVLSSDHFCPWTENHGQSGFAWSWLGAALQATTNIEFGVVNSPGQRYHPAVVAQACATLAEMYPDRFWITIDNGQKLNEHLTGTGWLSKVDRNVRLKECADIIRALWAGETVTKHGLVTVENARLYTLPEKKPMLLAAAVSEGTAKWVGGWADGMITSSDEHDQLQRVMDAFYSGGGEGKPIYLKVHLSYAKTEREARTEAIEQWRSKAAAAIALAAPPTPEQFYFAGQWVDTERLEQQVLISSSIQQHIDSLGEFAAMGFSGLFLHNVNRHQEMFIEDFGTYVIPALENIHDAMPG